MAVERIGELRANILPNTAAQKYSPQSELEHKAATVAKTEHSGMLRRSGEEYWKHLEATAAILKSWGVTDTQALAAAWVHDTVEDCPWISLQYIEDELGPEVAFIVNGVTKFNDVDTGKDEQLETHRKVLDNQYIDVRVALVKLADRVHNMSTMTFMTPEKQRQKSQETLSIYAPMAEALGLWDVKTYLEDVSFSYLEPGLYSQIKAQIDADPRLNTDFLTTFTSQVSHIVEKGGIEASLNVHVGGYYSLYKKREQLAATGQCDFDNFYGISDVVSVRVKTNSDNDSYRAIGSIHENLGELVDFSKYKDYLGANRRDNGYEVLQTTLVLPGLGRLEVAVTTHEKEEFNRIGVIQKINQQSGDLHEYQLKSVFLEGTGSERIRFLPQNATLIDLAYSVSDVVGASLFEAYIDGKSVPLDTVFDNASYVRLEIGPTKRAPDEQIVKAKDSLLPKTQHKIEAQLRLKRHDELVKTGQTKMESLLSPRGFLSLDDIGIPTQSLLNNLEIQSLNELYFYLGVGDSYISRVVSWLDRKGITKDKMEMTTIRLTGKDESGILSEITSVITANGGNIQSIKLSNDENKFQMRMAIEKLGEVGELSLKKYLLDCDKYTEVEVV